MNELGDVQKNVHAWGQANRVQLDAAKDLFAVLHRQTPVGNAFKLFDVMIDIRPNMADEVQRILKKARP